MVPVFDIMSHRNGKWLNTKHDSVLFGQQVRVFAARDIKAGEQIHTTYNFCTDCGGREDGYGTPEILRDYGFVEQYPQRWTLFDGRISFELAEDATTKALQVTWFRDGSEPDDAGLDYLNTKLEKLASFKEKNIETNHSILVTNDEPSPNEFKLVVQYHTALATAITKALESVEHDEYNHCLVENVCPTILTDRYDELGYREDDTNYNISPCDNSEIFEFSTYDDIGTIQSPYQLIEFFHDPTSLDTCFSIDGTTQICDSYRPHYHEIMVHYTARFLKNIKRVLWVGGGDSMLLHEFVKYPTLELIVGLELDQHVTRNSFKHFGTQPHWDQHRVEWWFGDATKSLLMLPKEYFGSFDMVLVDLSETVMSFAVTEELDIMGALALLLKKNGIMVKNEMYLEDMSNIFDYTIQIHSYDVPVLCSQAFILGSNGIDFLHQSVHHHNIQGENLLIKDVKNERDKFEVYHDYQRNIATSQKYCRSSDEPEMPEIAIQTKSPGILMIIEAEGVSVDIIQSKEMFRDAISASLVKVGLTVQSTVVDSLLTPEKGDKGETSNGGTGVSIHTVAVTLKEGYVLARSYPNLEYCAFDIHLWSTFEKHNDAEIALIKGVGGNVDDSTSSSYRIVAGGMFGTSNWKTDVFNRGPRYANICEEPEVENVIDDSDPPGYDLFAKVVLNETILAFTSDNDRTDILVAVLCGTKSEPCEASAVLEGQDSVARVVSLHTCDDSDSADSLFVCELEIVQQLKKAVFDSSSRVSAIVVDDRAPKSIGKILHKILTFRNSRKEILSEYPIIIATIANPTQEWRRNFLERFRRDILKIDPAKRAEILFNITSADKPPKIFSEVGIAASDPLFFTHLIDAIDGIKLNTALLPDIRTARGASWKWMPSFQPTNSFLSSDYDQTEPLKQYHSQVSLGKQSVFQLELKVVFKPPMVDSSIIREALEEVFRDENITAKIEQFDGETFDGDGCLFLAFWDGGSSIVLWDGRNHIDLNLFTHYEKSQVHNTFVATFLLSKLRDYEVKLHDEQPRGIGRVVNFEKDVGTFDLNKPEDRDPRWVQ